MFVAARTFPRLAEALAVRLAATVASDAERSTMPDDQALTSVSSTAEKWWLLKEPCGYAITGGGGAEYEFHDLGAKDRRRSLLAL